MEEQSTMTNVIAFGLILAGILVVITVFYTVFSIIMFIKKRFGGNKGDLYLKSYRKHFN